MKAGVTNIYGILLFLSLSYSASAAVNSALTADAAKTTAKQFFKSGKKTRKSQDIACNNQEFINCLALGDINIGSKFDALRQKLGEPWHTFPRSDGSIDEVYPLRIYQHSTVYWVISHKNNRIVAAQLTGNQAPQTILFAGLQLGDHQDLIIDTLGYPNGRRRYGRSSAYLWDYHPLPFTLEIFNNRLYSVRVHQSREKIPTDELSETLVARLTGAQQTPVNQDKNLNISQIAKAVVNDNGEFDNIITTAKNTAERKLKATVNDKIAQGAQQLAGENETINQAIGKASDKLQQKSGELIDKAGDKLTQKSDELIEQASQKGSEFISQKTKDTINELTDKAEQTIEQSTNEVKNEVKKAITAQFNPTQREVIEAVEQWTESWSQKDIPGYFSAYTNTYTPPTSASRNVWQDKREARINSQAWIKLVSSGFNFPKAAITNNNQVTVRFWLEYEVPGYKDKTLKSLTMVKTGNRWLIKQEQSLLVNKL